MHSETLSLPSLPPFHTYTLINIQLVHIHFKPTAHKNPDSFNFHFNFNQPKHNACFPIDSPLHRHAHHDRLSLHNSKDLQLATQVKARTPTLSSKSMSETSVTAAAAAILARAPF